MRGIADAELSRQFLRRRAADRHAPAPAMSSAAAIGRRIGSFPTASGRFNPGRPVTLRYPDAIRPWQHVLEPLSGYLSLAEALVQDAGQGAARCQFRTGPGILLHGARGGGCIQRALRRQARMGARPGAASPGGAGADAVVGLGRAERSAGVPDSTSASRCRGRRTGIGPIRRGRTWRRFQKRKLRGIGELLASPP